MRKKIIFCSLLLVLISSCGNTIKDEIGKKWKVAKMEKLIKVTSKKITPIDLDISSKMSYNFKSDGKVEMITQIGSNMNGKWSVKDSVITISVRNEKKDFKINKLTKKELIITSDNFKFYLEQ